MTARRKALAFVAVVYAAMFMASPTVAASHQSVNLRDLYPGTDGSMYLEGNNWISGDPQRSVLHFDMRRRGYFDQHNWGPTDPQADCNTDRFRWKSGTLRYLWTDNECDGNDTRTRYRPALRYMPEEWDGNEQWQHVGVSKVTHKDDGDVVRSGTTSYTSTVVGWVDSQPGRPVVWVRIELSTIWDNEPLSNTTHWVEDLYLDPQFGLARHAGGNANGQFNWDVWFTHWAPMP